MIAVYTPLNGKPAAILELIVGYINSLLSGNLLSIQPVLAISDDPVLVWDEPENKRLYNRIPSLIFVPVSNKARLIFGSGQPVARHEIQNYRLKEQEFSALFPVDRDQTTVASVSDQTIVFHADLIAQLFVLLTGWDEQFSPTDALNRVLFKGSLIDYLDASGRPLAEETVSALVHALQLSGVPAVFRYHFQHAFRVRITHDIDHLTRWTPGFFLRYLVHVMQKTPGFSLSGLAQEWKQSRRQADPYTESLNWLMEESEKQAYSPTFFLRAGKSDKRDSQLNFNAPVIGQIRAGLTAGNWQAGLHPSIRSAVDLSQMISDLAKLKEHVPDLLPVCRQHFLMFDPVQTPGIHDDAGITTDFSLGFHDHEGFRRGSVHPFPGFRFDTWQQTRVWYVPLIYMDATAEEYRRLPVEDATNRLISLLEAVRRWNGDVSILFHNDFHPGYHAEKTTQFGQIIQWCKSNHAWLKADHV